MNNSDQFGQNPQPAPQFTNPANTGQITFLSLIKDVSSILIVLPARSSFDQVAAGLSLFLALSKHKSTQIFSPSPMTVEFNRLIGIDKISNEVGNKNLVIRFLDYDATQIERVSYDIEENNQFKLTVIPKHNSVSPKKENVSISYSGVSADAVIAVGGRDVSDFSILDSSDFSTSRMIHVGLTPLQASKDKKYVSFSRVGSSVSEIVYGLIRENQLYIDVDIATNLMMGIEEMVGDNFEGEGITAETFYTVADLMQYGAKRHSNKGLTGSFPPGSIPTPAGQSGNNQVTQTPQPSGLWGVPGSPQSQKGAISNDLSEEQDNEATEEEAPSDWLKPKIYKSGSGK
jgi:hypothetical protein